MRRNWQICTLAVGEQASAISVQIGGSAHGYQDFFRPLAKRQSRLRHDCGPAWPYFLYIAMLGVNVLN